jgi:hypothetical protein
MQPQAEQPTAATVNTDVQEQYDINAGVELTKLNLVM